MKAVKLNLLNHVSGALLGAVKALCILSVLLNVVVMVDKDEMLVGRELKNRSVLYGPVYTTGNKLTAELKVFVEEHKEEVKEVVK